MLFRSVFEGINAGDSDYSAVITKLKSQGVDFVYFGGYHPEMGLLLRQAREQGVKATFMGPEGVGNKDVTAIAGPASEGMLVTLPADFSADPANAGLVKAFADKKRDANGPFQMPAYAAVKIIGDAIAGAKSTDPTKVAAYMHKNAFTTPIGKVDMVNLIVRLPGRRTDRILFTGHYDTKPIRGVTFVGASDGASSAAMLEIGRAHV